MKIVQVETFALRAQPLGGDTYWGKATWGTQDAQSENISSRATSSSTEAFAQWNRFPAPGRMRPVYSNTVDTTLVKLTTDDGLIGWGEAKAPVAPEVCKCLIDQLFVDQLLGRDPFEVEVLWETLYASMRLRGHASGFFMEALSGVDIALWDLVGKATGQPLYKLLGGAYRDRVKVYASGVPGTLARKGEPDWERMLGVAQRYLDRGFFGFKVAIGLEPAADLCALRALRELAGPKISILADAAGNYDVSTAIRLGHELEGLDIGFFEAPLPHEFFDGYAEVAHALDIPVANDVLTNRFQVLEYLKRGGLDIVQPDVCRAGGITELKRIAVLADTFGAAFTPHVSIGSAVHVAASLHLAASTPNFIPMEFWAGANPLGDAVLKTPVFEVVDGCLTVPTEPGLGLDIDEAKLQAHVSSVEVVV